MVVLSRDTGHRCWHPGVRFYASMHLYTIDGDLRGCANLFSARYLRSTRDQPVGTLEQFSGEFSELEKNTADNEELSLALSLKFSR